MKQKIVVSELLDDFHVFAEIVQCAKVSAYAYSMCTFCVTMKSYLAVM